LKTRISAIIKKFGDPNMKEESPKRKTRGGTFFVVVLAIGDFFPSLLEGAAARLLARASAFGLSARGAGFLLWKTRFLGKVVFSQGEKAFFGKPAEKRGGLRKNSSEPSCLFPLLCGKGRRQAQ
jgi:dipeptide/tripeptide permease